MAKKEQELTASMIALANAVSIKMLDNAISSNESLGVGLAKMMENSVYPNLGSNIDVSV